MGCSQSKGDPERDAVTSKITPLLRRRFEEIKGRKNNNTDAHVTLSKRSLLKQSSTHEDDPSLSNNSHSVDENDNIDRNCEASPDESCLKDENNMLEQNGEIKATDFDQMGLQERLLDETAENDDEENSSEAEGRPSNVDMSYLCPGSPSFRVYCVDHSANDEETHDYKDNESDQKYEDDDKGETTLSKDSDEVAPELVTLTKGKGKNGVRFMKVMGMGKQAGAVKNLLNVSSCYQARRHNPRLLPQQAA